MAVDTQKDVLGFYVSVDYFLGVEVGQAEEDLYYVESGHLLA